MIRLVKKLVVLLVVLAVLLVAGAYWADGFAKGKIEATSTELLGVSTTIGDMDIGFLDSDCAIDDLVIANPEGFSATPFLAMKRGEVEVSLSTLLGDEIVIPRLALSDIALNLEMTGTSGNYDRIIERMKRSSSDEPKKDAKRYVIEDLLIRNVTVDAKIAPIGGLGDALGTGTKITIPEIHLKEIGSGGDGGVTLEQLGSIIVQTLLTAAANDPSKLLPSIIGTGLNSKLAGLDGLEKQGLQVIGDLKKVLEGGGALNDAGKALEKLFPPMGK